MARRPQSVHWLRENAREASPHRLLVVDTETAPPDPADPDRQTLRLWCGRLIRRHAIEPRRVRTEDYRGETADELAALVDGLARASSTLWLVTHNLNFDLAVTELPVLLTERGWTITDAALTTDSPWARLVKGSRRLTIADSWSWLPGSVESIGKLIGRPKLPLPEWEAADSDWYDRCTADVDIVARALVSVMDWWDAGRFGNWSITGPATGWSSYRHRKPRPYVLIIPDPERRAFEMAAVTGGRREVRRLGELPAGLYADLDLSTAHLTAMTGFPLPAKPLGPFESLPLDHRALDSSILDVMALATVETTAPRYPWDSGRGVFYPVGRFRTLLPGPELREARARGELRSIGPGRLYLVSPHMADWALWLATLLDAANPDVPPAVRLLAKHWSRCVPGKWAGHASDVISREPDPRAGWQLERAMLMPERRPADLLRIGGERWTIVRDEWADDAFPAILAWIQSATRVALGRLVDVLGPAVVSMNTDGVIVDVHRVIAEHGPDDAAAAMRDPWQLRELAELASVWDTFLEPFSVRVKSAAGKLTVISPQHLIMGDERRLAGIPAKAIRLADGAYTFTQWPKLRVQLQHPEGPGYRTRQARVDLAHVPPAGWLFDDCTVAPITVYPGPDGADTIAPPHVSMDGRAALAAPGLQHPALRRLLPAP